MADTSLLNNLFQRTFVTDLQLADILDFITERVSISEYAEEFPGVEVEFEISLMAADMAPDDIFDKKFLDGWIDSALTDGDLIDKIHGRDLDPQDVYNSEQIADSFSDEALLKEVDIRLDDDQLIELCEGRGLVFRHSSLAA